MTDEVCAVPAPKVRGSQALLAFVLVCAGLLAACGGTPQATQAPAADPESDMAEKAFVDATHTGDAAALGNLLDANFVWIAADGKTFNRADTLKTLPKPALADETGADISRFTYSNAVHTVTVSSGKTHLLRIWAKRPEGWRALVYQEVQAPDASPTVAASANCDNPCKNIPFVPQDDTQKDVANAYMGLEAATVAHDAPLWSLHSAYEFMAAGSNMADTLNKTTRLAQLQQKNTAGLTPLPLVSATMQEFPGVVVMRSKHQGANGTPVEATRLFIRRNDIWIITLNFQTAVQPT